MPELPEVERGRVLASSVAERRSIKTVSCARDEIVFDGVTPAKMRSALAGRRVEAVRRRGKHLWFELDKRPWPCFHFGMTGSFRGRGQATLQLVSGPKEDRSTWPPRFTKIHLTFDDGGELVMTNARRFGRIRLREDPEREPPISGLGFDPLLDLPSPRDFIDRLSARRGAMKSVLMDQSFAAGVGNWIADEVLFQAKIDPRRPADSLSPEEMRRVRSKLKHVVQVAVDAGGEGARFPRNWLFHRRWGRQRDVVTRQGDPIVHITLAGRTTAWVPRQQA